MPKIPAYLVYYATKFTFQGHHFCKTPSQALTEIAKAEVYAQLEQYQTLLQSNTSFAPICKRYK